jgi:hypothetical protein
MVKVYPTIKVGDTLDSSNHPINNNLSGTLCGPLHSKL